MDARVAEFINDLMAADSFEPAAEITLRALLGQASRALAASRYAEKGKLLRGMVHLRPEGGYRGLVVLEAGAQHSIMPAPENTMLPSATMWSSVAATGGLWGMDVMLAVATPLGGTPLVLRGLADKGQPGTAFASQDRLIGRDVTHLVAIPLHSSPRQIAGMISIEASCATAMGQPFIWDTCAAELKLLSNLATPYLLSRPLRTPAPSSYAGDAHLPVIGRGMRSLVHLLRVFAQQPETVLISGPTGVGKSRIARWCHAQSPRRDRPFEAVDLHGVPKEMQLAELFGWRKGAFTGAVSDHFGLVQRADGGTLFIDEIDKLSLDAQAGLLQLLEERSYRSLGDRSGARHADVRFLVGTNIDLHAAVREGRFREDLYYRINVLPVALPPLRERTDEIIPWASYMLSRRHEEGGGGGSAQLCVDAGLALTGFAWPGNLRQLDNVIRRAYAMGLAELSDTQTGFELQRSHVERALAFEHQGDHAGLPQLLRQVARAYTLEAERRHRQGAPLRLDLAEAFSGLVLSAAVTLAGGRKEAFQMFGLSHMVEGRNHHKAFERAVVRVQEALKELGEPLDPDITNQLKG